MFTATFITEGGLDLVFSEILYQFDLHMTAGDLKSSKWVEDRVVAEFAFAPASDFGIGDCSILADGLRDHAVAIAKGGFGRDLTVDVIVQPSAHRRRRLLVADMDSTMITVECIDELADYAGLKDEVADITERAMRGELGFEQALEARVSLLAGMDAALIDRCREERVQVTPGAKTLVRTMKAEGATCILVSGGFTRFADAVAREIGFDRVVANVLELGGERLSGRVLPPIVGAEAKRAALLGAAAEFGIPVEATLAVGDGANDIPMLRAAGLGIAYHAKPAAAAAADARIDHNDLTAVLYAQGYSKPEWVEA